MKKLILWAILVLFVSSIAFHLSFYLSGKFHGEKVMHYHRFYSDDGQGEHFNWYGLLFPIQAESQKIIRDTVNFTHKVQYPIGPHFNVVAPQNSSEDVVAKEIAKVISDSISKIKMNLSMDYDGEAIAVRKAANPETPKLKDPTISLSLFGTASPEALKYGLEKSLQPDSIEKENVDLASHRLLRTDTLILKNLLSLGINNVKITDTKSEELQLNSVTDVKNVMMNLSVLDSMRYVKADVSITTERLVITPATAPIALPLWLGLFSLLVLGLVSLRKAKKLDPPTELASAIAPSKSPKESWWGVILLLLMILVALLALMLLFPKWVIIAMLIAIFIYAIYLLKDSTAPKMPKFNFLEWLRNIWEWIRMVFAILWILIESLFENIFYWWVQRTTCQKILLIHFLIDIVIFIAWLTGIWTIC